MVWEDDAAHAQAFTYTLTGKLASVSDAAGERVFAYNEYDELMTDSLTADEVTHVITENRDEYGRGIGYGYAKNNNVQQSVSYGYGTDGRLCSAGFTHSGESKQFEFSYLSGSNLLQTLTMPNGMTLTQQFETQRDLMTGMEYKRGTSGVVERYYTYDSLGRPLTRQQNRQGGSRSDSFTHNDRSELTAGILGTKGYYYSYDNIGNRKTAKEDADEATNYDANALNQYTAVGSFVPEFDADGNQTKVQTCTGIWNVTYNAENRPIVFERTNSDGTTTRVTCAYDYMGRRTTKKVETVSVSDTETGESTATTILHQRYIYRGYLQIAGFDLTESSHSFRWFITWDPTQPVATRPLAIRKDGTWYCYGWDLTKNVCEVFSKEGYISNTVLYSYTPYGAVTAEGSVTQPIQWSSEFYDDELGLVHYTYRSYNSTFGKWINRDPASENNGYNLYAYVRNEAISRNDSLGLSRISDSDFTLDPKSCTLNIDLDIRFEFLTKLIYPMWPTDSNGLTDIEYVEYTGIEWSENMKNQYKQEVMNGLTKVWNNQFKLILSDGNGNPCTACKPVCSNGIKLGISPREDTWKTQTDILLRAVAKVEKPHPKYKFEDFRSNGELGGYKISLAQGTDNLDYVVSHEFGHILGLQHPGTGKLPEELKNKHEDYRYIGLDAYGNIVNGLKDLMGAWNARGLRGFYFKKWEDYMNSRKSKCPRKIGCNYKAVRI